MQVITSYFYPNLIEVQHDVDPLIITRNRIVYARLIKIYKGVDNLVKIQVKNRDQKPVNIEGFVVKFNILSDDGETLLLTLPATIIDTVKGIATVMVTAYNLIDLQAELYNYSISVSYPDGSEQVVYSDDNYEVRGELRIAAGHYPRFKQSVDVGISTLNISPVYTSSTLIDSMTRGQSSNHIAQFYFDNFSGEIVVEGTLSPIGMLGESIVWSPMASVFFMGQNTTDYMTWQGNLTAYRFVITKQSGDVTRILVRS